MDYINPNIFGLSTLGYEDHEALQRVLNSGALFRFHAEHSENSLFESELISFLASNPNRPLSAATFSSGTAALRAALITLGVKAGDIVGVSAYTFLAPAAVVASLGAWPCPIDIDLHLGVDLEDLEEKLSTLQGFVMVYAPGQSSNTPAVSTLVKKHGKFLIEDACQALGVSITTTSSGGWGALGAFSFQQYKQISCGEGGALVGDPSLVEKAARYADHGAVRDGSSAPRWNSTAAMLGDNLRLSEIQAALLRTQLRRLPLMRDVQRTVSNHARALLAAGEIPCIATYDPEGDSGAYLPIILKDAPSAETCIKRCAAKGILARHFWRTPFHEVSPMASYLRNAPCAASRFNTPHASDLARRIIAFPIPPLLESSRLTHFLETLEKLCPALRELA